MPYATNLPRRNRPRGLGEAAARAASGFGTWIVDNFWGLSPKNISGQPRPYGQTVVQTLLPRTNLPRLLDLHMGPVVPGGTWPELRRMNNQPVFRTPVERPGALQVSLPPGAGPGPRSEEVQHRLAGFGYIPMGVATRPAYLLEQPGLQGFGAFGQTDTTTVEAMGVFAEMTPEDAAKSAGALRNIFLHFVQIYMARTHQAELFSETLDALAVSIPNVNDRIRRAELIVYGDPLYPNDQQRASARRNAAYTELNELDRMRLAVIQHVPLSATTQWPADLRTAYQALVERDAPSITALSFGQEEAVAAAAGPLGWAYIAGKWGIALLVIGGVIAVGAGAIVLYQWLFESDKLARIKATNARADYTAAQAKVELEYAATLETLRRKAELAPTQQERSQATNALEQLMSQHLQLKQRQAADNQRTGVGRAGTIAAFGIAVVVALMGTRLMAARRGGRRRERRHEGRRHEERRRGYGGRGRAEELLRLPA